MTKLFQIFVVGLCFFAAAAQAADTLHGAVRFWVNSVVSGVNVLDWPAF